MASALAAGRCFISSNCVLKCATVIIGPVFVFYRYINIKKGKLVLDLHDLSFISEAALMVVMTDLKI